MSRGYTVLWHSEAVVTHNVSWFQSVLNLWALLLLSCGVWLHVCAFCSAGCLLSFRRDSVSALRAPVAPLMQLQDC